MSKRSLLVVALSVVAAAASAGGRLLDPFGKYLHSEAAIASSSQILVKVKAGSETSAAKSIATNKYKVVRTIPSIGWQTLQLPTGVTPEAAKAKLLKTGYFSNAEKNWILAPTMIPNDPLYNLEYGAPKIQLPAAWDLITNGGAGVIIAVIDTGLDGSHEEFVGRTVPGFNFVDNNTNTQDEGYLLGDGSRGVGHGTHVSGTAAAATNNGLGIAGNAYGATIMPLRIYTPATMGAGSDTILAAVAYAADHGANVINMSLGGNLPAGVAIPQYYIDGIRYATNRGVTVVASAGNSSLDNATYHAVPGDVEEVICVGSSDQTDQRSGFSNYGTPVDVAAPGSDIISSFPPALFDASIYNGPNYGTISGTSMASPQVAGLAALVIGTAGVGTLSPTEVRAYIEDNCDNIGTWMTHGRVNAYRAISAIGTPLVSDSEATTPEPIDGATFPNGTDPSVLSTADSLSLMMVSKKKSGVGLTGAFATNFTMSGIEDSELRSAVVNFKLSGDRKATIQLFIWNDTNGKWVLYSAKPATVAQSALVFNLPKTTLTSYMFDGGLRIMVRSLVPTSLVTGANGVTTIDQLSVTYKGVRRPGATP